MSGNDENDDGIDADVRLFHASIGRVRRLQPADESGLRETSTPSTEPRQFLLDEARVRDELLSRAPDPATIEVGDEISHLKAGQPPSLLKRLRRGDFSVRAEIDLHEMSSAVARNAIREFLEESHRHREYCVRIVHGKGLRSKSRGPVLKQLTDSMLRQRADVLAFASARPAQGGTGAVLVLLQRG